MGSIGQSLVLRRGRVQRELHQQLPAVRLVQDGRPERPGERVVPVREPDRRDHRRLPEAGPRRELRDFRRQPVRRKQVGASVCHRGHLGDLQACRKRDHVQRVRVSLSFRRCGACAEELRRHGGLHAGACEHHRLARQRLHRRGSRRVGHAAVEGDGVADDTGPQAGGQRRHLGRRFVQHSGRGAAARRALPDRQPRRAAHAGGRSQRPVRRRRGRVDAADRRRQRRKDHRALVRDPAGRAEYPPAGPAVQRHRLLLERGHLALDRGQRRDDRVQPRQFDAALFDRRADTHEHYAARPDGRRRGAARIEQRARPGDRVPDQLHAQPVPLGRLLRRHAGSVEPRRRLGQQPGRRRGHIRLRSVVDAELCDHDQRAAAFSAGRAHRPDRHGDKRLSDQSELERIQRRDFVQDSALA